MEDLDWTNPAQGVTEQDVRLDYAEREARNATASIPVLFDVSPSAFMDFALNLENDV
jgi:hypothetical protein